MGNVVDFDDAEFEVTGARLRNALDRCTGVGIVLSTETGVIIFANAEAAAMLGCSVADLLRGTGRPRLHDDDRSRENALHLELLSRPGATRLGVARYRHHDGSWRTIESRIHNLLHDPSVSSVLSVFRDVTEARAAEVRSAERAENNATVLSMLETPIVYFSRGVVTYANVACTKILDEPRMSLANAPLEDVFGPDFAAAVTSRFDRDGSVYYQFARRSDHAPVAVALDAFALPFQQTTAVVLHSTTHRQPAFPRRELSLDPWLRHAAAHTEKALRELAGGRTPDVGVLRRSLLEVAAMHEVIGSAARP